MKKIIIILILATTSIQARALEYKAPSKEEIEVALKTFKFKGQWIHPSIIKEFMPWSSDYNYPLIISIDVAAATNANRFFGQVKTTGPFVSYTSNDGSIMSYKWMGQLKNGTHIIHVQESGSGGTLVSNTLALFELSTRIATNESDTKYPQLILAANRLITLGDRASVDLKIDGNNIDVNVTCIKTCDSKKFTIKM